MISEINLGKDVKIKNGRNNPFKGCYNLRKLEIDNYNNSIDSRENCNAIIQTSTNTLLFGCVNTTIPKSVIKLESGAFTQCLGLTSIKIPSHIESISGNVFSECEDLTQIIVDPGNTVYDSRENCNAIIVTSTNTLISGCMNTIIPDTVSKIADSAFQGITGLTTLSIPASVISIGSSSFNGCSALRTVPGLANVKTIGSYTFGDCDSLISADLSSVEGLIDYACFDGCSSLSTVTFGKNITRIRDHAFGGAAMTEIIFPEDSKLERLDYHCFDENNNLRYVVLPDGLTTLGPCIFSQCRNLEKVIMPNSVTSIDYGAF
jgi:hypothetical protein